jgi:spore germination protein GerM
MIKLPRGFYLYLGIAAVLGLGLIGLYLVGPRWLSTGPAAPTEQSAAPAAAPADARKIRARLFYVDDAGTGLIDSEQEVVYGQGTTEQATRIVEAQLTAPPAPLVSAIPPGTTLRTLFVTADGAAYVDLSAEAQKNHPGGTTNEMLTVYSIVSALTTNLPAITGVQILVEGREVDTLAGHLDLRRPIEPDERYAHR